MRRPWVSTLPSLPSSSRMRSAAGSVTWIRGILYSQVRIDCSNIGSASHPFKWRSPEPCETASEPILEPDLPIVDPHHHLWDRPASLVAGDAPHRARVRGDHPRHAPLPARRAARGSGERPPRARHGLPRVRRDVPGRGPGSAALRRRDRVRERRRRDDRQRALRRRARVCRHRRPCRSPAGRGRRGGAARAHRGGARRASAGSARARRGTRIRRCSVRSRGACRPGSIATRSSARASPRSGGSGSRSTPGCSSPSCPS